MGENGLQDLGSWRDIVAERFDVRNVSSRQFSSLTGLPEASVDYIYSKYCLDEYSFDCPLACPRDEASLLMFFNFLKDYSVEDNFALYWHIGKSGFRENNKNTLMYLSANLDEVRIASFRFFARLPIALSSSPSALPSFSSLTPFCTFLQLFYILFILDTLREQVIESTGSLLFISGRDNRARRN